MKDSGIDWVGKIPEEWELRRLKYTLDERKQKNDPVITDNILSLSVKRGVFPYAEKTGGGNKAKSDLTAYKVTYPNDIVINSMNILAGAVGLSKYEGAVSPVYYTLYSNSENINIEYFYLMFRTEVFQRSLLGLGNGIMMKESSTGKLNTIRMRIPMDRLANLVVPVPSKNVQDKIVSKLNGEINDIDKVINETSQSIEELKKYKQSFITETVTKGLDPNVEMKETLFLSYNEIPKNWNESKLKYNVFLDPSVREHIGDLPDEATFLPMDRLKNGYLINTETEKSINLQKKYTYFAENDILFAKVRPSFENGNIAIAKGLKNSIGFGSSEIYVLRNKSKSLVNKFLFYFLRNDLFIFEGSSSMTGVAGLQRVSSSFVLNYPIALPPREEQLQIVFYLDEQTARIDKLIEDKTKVIEELESYKKSLVYEYVTGKKEV